jgi:hypothetical protein
MKTMKKLLNKEIKLTDNDLENYCGKGEITEIWPVGRAFGFIFYNYESALDRAWPEINKVEKINEKKYKLIYDNDCTGYCIIEVL